jgi:hypothetical protein
MAELGINTLVKLAIPVLRRDLSIEGAGKHQPR